MAVDAEATNAMAMDANEAARGRSLTRSRVAKEALSWFWVILAFLFIEGSMVQARVIPSGSMERTVLIGDHLIVSRFGYDLGVPFTPWHEPLWRAPKRQQIIVFRAPLPEMGNPDFIKRVIGLPGDLLEVRRGVVYIDNQPLAEPYRKDPPNPGDNYGPVKVPADEYFMMGDNRNNSYDSRFWGFVPRSNIVGTPLLIYMSIDAPEEVWEPGHIGMRFATYLNALIHPREVRWTRLFHTF
ncbi:MAG TPA: signal peptidase I [Candidatus Acidoferrales bacterium]|nr:signal peptidase I [Candidatus Acidoferrales bacterium]